MKKPVLFFIIAIVIILILISLRLFVNGGEDTWTKDSRGVYVKHGVPLAFPAKVQAQQDAIACANTLYIAEKSKDATLNSQCLGTCGDYAVDIVHVPRSDEDNLPQNQCSDFRNGNVKHFIELDAKGEIVRIT